MSWWPEFSLAIVALIYALVALAFVREIWRLPVAQVDGSRLAWTALAIAWPLVLVLIAWDGLKRQLGKQP